MQKLLDEIIDAGFGHFGKHEGKYIVYAKQGHTIPNVQADTFDQVVRDAHKRLKDVGFI